MSEHQQGPNPYEKKIQQLKLLGILHFVGAGLAVLGLGMVVVHFLVFRYIMEHPQPGFNMPPQMNTPAFKAMLMVAYGFWGGFILLSLVLNLMAGLFLRECSHRVFCLIVAGFNCLHVPLGTALGIFTFVVLLDDRTKELYAAAASPDEHQPLHPPSA